MSIGPSAHTDCSATCRFDPVVAVAFGEPQDPEARAKALLGVRALLQNLVGKLARCRAEFLRPGKDARRSPLRLRAVLARHVVRDGGEATSHTGAPVRPDSVTVVEKLDRRLRESRFELLVAQGMRDGVEV